MTRRLFLPALLAVGVVLSAVVSPAWGADGPPQVHSTSYEFAAASPAAKGSGAGAFGAELARGGRGLVRVVAGRARVTASVRRWEVRVDGARVTLTLRLETSSSSDHASCPVGAKGVVTLVDDAVEPANDSVRVAFASGRCGAFSRSWAESGEQTARVRIDVLFAVA